MSAQRSNGCSRREVALPVSGDARRVAMRRSCLISTDPPYYDNIGYSDLSDFFYVWLRRSLRNVIPTC